MEGGRKLKAEKPFDEKDYLKEREKILKEVEKFLEYKDFKPENKIYKRFKKFQPHDQ